ncbi:prion-inhibition and propagation-domain-containing protein [Stachybotrys elegans]|uniref:Prion-inhibition and propagation-domain-containing protein n=1 Tax=Stachybotrys elegans TaxID=80388 RepID=A0A8K0T4J8_9HYPO|nr:prion-inhibition and propagation-domain-containing protein [Stachybotrys elegans]
MAEAAGLAFGAVGLLGLAQTCIEACQYIEAGKSMISDLSLAITKIHLLQRRLHQWTEGVQIHDMQSWEMEKPIEEQCPTDGNAILECLGHISNILTRVVLLSGRYQHGKSPYTFETPLSSVVPADTSYIRSSSPVPSSASTALRHKVIWAIKDKRRLDRWITDLEFLVSCLEELGMDKRRLTHHGEVNPLSEIKANDSKSLVKRNTPAPKAGLAPKAPDTTDRGGSHVHHVYRDNKSRADWTHNGDIGHIVRDPNLKGHLYQGADLEGKATTFGDMSVDAFKALIEAGKI